jgi:hypothetical protein
MPESGDDCKNCKYVEKRANLWVITLKSIFVLRMKKRLNHTQLVLKIKGLRNFFEKSREGVN